MASLADKAFQSRNGYRNTAITEGPIGQNTTAIMMDKKDARADDTSVCVCAKEPPLLWRKNSGSFASVIRGLDRQRVVPSTIQQGAWTSVCIPECLCASATVVFKRGSRSLVRHNLLKTRSPLAVLVVSMRRQQDKYWLVSSPYTWVCDTGEQNTRA